MRQRSNNLPQQQRLYPSTPKTSMFNLFVATHSSLAPTSIFPFPSSYLCSGAPKTTPLLRPWSYSAINLPTDLSGPMKNLSPFLVKQQQRFHHRSIRLLSTIRVIKTKTILLSRQGLQHCSCPPPHVQSIVMESFSVALLAASGRKR